MTAREVPPNLFTKDPFSFTPCVMQPIQKTPLRLSPATLLAVLFVSCASNPKDGPNSQAWVHWEAPGSIRTLDVVSETHLRCAASDGWVGQTTDGIHWNHRKWLAPDSTAPSFRSSGANGTHWFAASISSPAWVARTSPEGWEPEWVHHDTTKAVFLDAMAWWNEREGLVFGDPVEECLTLLITRDGGQTWTPTPCNIAPIAQTGEAGFAASNGNICVQGDTAWVFSGGTASRCLRSTDRGLSWDVFELPIRQGEAMTGVFGASFANARRGLAIGGNWEHPDDNFGNLIATRDGGETWRLLAEGTGPGYRSCIVHHPRNSQQVVASGFQGVDVSLDGGRTWRHVSDSSRYVARFSPSGRTLWLAGKRSLSRVSWDAISLP